MPITKPSEVTQAEKDLRKELEVRFSRVLAEVLRQPRSEGVPSLRVGSACAVAIFNAMRYICPLVVMDELIQDYFDESFRLCMAKILAPLPPLPTPAVFRASLDPPKPSPPKHLFESLLHRDDTQETRESEVNQALLALSAKSNIKEKK